MDECIESQGVERISMLINRLRALQGGEGVNCSLNDPHIKCSKGAWPKSSAAFASLFLHFYSFPVPVLSLLGSANWLTAVNRKSVCLEETLPKAQGIRGLRVLPK